MTAAPQGFTACTFLCQTQAFRSYAFTHRKLASKPLSSAAHGARGVTSPAAGPATRATPPTGVSSGPAADGARADPVSRRLPRRPVVLLTLGRATAGRPSGA